MYTGREILEKLNIDGTGFGIWFSLYYSVLLLPILVFPVQCKALKLLRFSEISSPYLVVLLGWKTKKWAGHMKKNPWVLELEKQGKCNNWTFKMCWNDHPENTILFYPYISGSKVKRNENSYFTGYCTGTRVKWMMWVWSYIWLFIMHTLCGVVQTAYG